MSRDLHSPFIEKRAHWKQEVWASPERARDPKSEMAVVFDRHQIAIEVASYEKRREFHEPFDFFAERIASGQIPHLDYAVQVA